MSRTIRDATGRAVRVGDVVGGTAHPPLVTVTGAVAEIGYSQLCLTVATVSTPGRFAPRIGERLCLPAKRTFLLHSDVPESVTLAEESGQTTSLRWTGQAQDLQAAAEFTGPSLVGALDTEAGWTLFIRVRKGVARPDAVLPGWFILRPKGQRLPRVCSPITYDASYATFVTAVTDRPAPEEATRS